MGEIEFGYAVQHNRNPGIEAEYRRFVREQLPAILAIDRHTAEPYGRIRGALFDKYAPKELKPKAKRPEQLIDPITAQPLGIDENDLWIAAQAVEFNLCLVTGDAMSRIREAIKLVYPDFVIVDWSNP